MRRCGTPGGSSSCPSPTARISCVRRSAFSRLRPEGTDGPLRHRSRSEIRDPAGTSSSISRIARCPGVSSWYNVSYSRSVASSRTRATSRAIVVTPGSSTELSRSHPTAAVKMVFAPSPVFHARASIHFARSFSASRKSFRA